VPHAPHASSASPVLPSPLAGALLLSPWTSFATTAASYRENGTRDALTPSVVRRFRGAFLGGTDALPATREADAWRYAAARGGREEEADPVLVEPVVPWGGRGRGGARGGYWLHATEAPGEWWAGLEDVVSQVMITAGARECFRDDILAFEATLRALKTRDGSGPAIKVGAFLDDAVHAAVVSDFAVGIEPGEQMEEIMTWLKQTFRPRE